MHRVLLPSLFAIAACSSASPPSGPVAPTPLAAQSAPPPPDCSKPPAIAPAEQRPSNAFTATNPDAGIEKGTARLFQLGDAISESSTEGGQQSITIVGHNECGLWVNEFYSGSESGGDIGANRNTVTLVKREAGSGTSSYVVDRLNVNLTVVASSLGEAGFTATLNEAIVPYIGE